MVTKHSGNSCNGKEAMVTGHRGIVALPALAPPSPKCLSTFYRVAVTGFSINNNHNVANQETNNDLH